MLQDFLVDSGLGDTSSTEAGADGNDGAVPPHQTEGVLVTCRVETASMIIVMNHHLTDYAVQVVCFLLLDLELSVQCPISVDDSADLVEVTRFRLGRDERCIMGNSLENPRKKCDATCCIDESSSTRVSAAAPSGKLTTARFMRRGAWAVCHVRSRFFSSLNLANGRYHGTVC
jgi:hypothetical protein